MAAEILPITEKRCPSCGVVKDLTEFHRSRWASLGNRQGARKQCQRAYRQQPHIRDKANIRQRLRQYRITQSQYERLYEQQGGRCANPNCNRGAWEKKRGLFIDHDHDTKLIRGLLCSGCNTSLWALGDTLEKLAWLRSYLDGENVSWIKDEWEDAL
jgi:hypothetical protein